MIALDAAVSAYQLPTSLFCLSHFPNQVMVVNGSHFSSVVTVSPETSCPSLADI